MVADLNTMPEMFWECNAKYFNGELDPPKYDTFSKLRVFARFSCYPKPPKGKNGKRRTDTFISDAKISFSDCYDFEEEDFRNIMAHEMIHYYLAHKGVDLKCSHGKAFMEMAERMNAEYGLNIVKDAGEFTPTRTGKEPTGFFERLFG